MEQGLRDRLRALWLGINNGNISYTEDQELTLCQPGVNGLGEPMDHVWLCFGKQGELELTFRQTQTQAGYTGYLPNMRKTIATFSVVLIENTPEELK